MFKQIMIILVVIALALTVTGCCCCGGSGYNSYYPYSEAQDVENSASAPAAVDTIAVPADST